MTISSKDTKDIIEKFGRTSKGDTKDTGCSEVQCAVFTKRIENLTSHLKTHKKDFSSRRGLLILVSRRKRLLEYLKINAFDRYEALIAKLGLRK